jgi:hypothetical protein
MPDRMNRIDTRNRIFQQQSPDSFLQPILSILFILSDKFLKKRHRGGCPGAVWEGGKKSAFSRGGHVTWKALSFLSF